MDELSNENLIIEDIDQPLYKYCLFYRFDLSNKYVTKKQRVFQRIKSNILSIHIILFAIRNAICLLINKNGRIPLYYFDLFQYFGGIYKFIYVCAIISCIMTVKIVYILNNSNEKHYKWFKIIEILKGLDTFERNKIHDKNIIIKYVQRIKLIKLIMSLVCYSAVLFSVVISFTIILIFFDLSNFLILVFGIISSLHFMLYCLYLIYCAFIQFSLLFHCLLLL